MHAPEDSRLFPSGRTVADCRKDAKRLVRSTGISLSEAQRQVAVANGAPQGWDRAAPTLLPSKPRSSLFPAMNQDDIRAILKSQPFLTRFGYGPSTDAIREAGSLQAALVAGQKDLLSHVDECNKALRFLQYVDKRKTNNRRVGSSYSLKHQAEHYLRHVESQRPDIPYVSNGAFICAALYCGFTMKAMTDPGPNVTFNMSSRSPVFEWQRIAKRPTYGAPAIEARKNHLSKLVGASMS